MTVEVEGCPVVRPRTGFPAAFCTVAVSSTEGEGAIAPTQPTSVCVELRCQIEGLIAVIVSSI